MIEQYILSIVVFAVFALMLIMWLGTYIFNRYKENKLRRQIEDMYNDENLAKMEYDFASYDDKTERMISTSTAEGQITIDDVIFDNLANVVDEGMEEITGNYKPD